MKSVILTILILLISNTLYAGNLDDSTEIVDNFKNSGIRIFYAGNKNNVYKDIYLHFGIDKCGIESLDWKSFKIFIRDITSDSLYKLAEEISKTNDSVNCNTMKNEDNDLFVLFHNLEGHQTPRIILNRTELHTLFVKIENNFDYHKLTSEKRNIMLRFYAQLQRN